MAISFSTEETAVIADILLPFSIALAAPDPSINPTIKLGELVSDTHCRFYAYYDPRDARSLIEAQDDMLEMLAAETYDVVLGFSEGAAMAASLMSRHARDNPLNTAHEALFSCAIFMSGMRPFKVLNEEPTTMRRFDAAFDGTVIDVPTLHIIGKKDPWIKENLGLRDLCEQRLTQTVFHDGGHEIPKSPRRVTLEMAQAIRDIIEKAKIVQ